MRGFVFAARWQIKRCHDPAGGTNQARPRSGKFASRKAGTRGQMPQMEASEVIDLMYLLLPLHCAW